MTLLMVHTVHKMAHIRYQRLHIKLSWNYFCCLKISWNCKCMNIKWNFEMTLAPLWYSTLCSYVHTLFLSSEIKGWNEKFSPIYLHMTLLFLIITSFAISTKYLKKAISIRREIWPLINVEFRELSYLDLVMC